jgi:hypothetical protein
MPLFFGLLVVLIGISIVFEAIFQVHLPIVRIALGLFFIYLGVRFLTGRRWHDGETHMRGVFSDDSYAPSGGNRVKHDVIFGRGVVDLTRLAHDGAEVRAEVNTIFGATIVKIDSAVPLEIEVSSAFAEARLPDQSVTAIGSLHYRPAGQKDAPRLHVRLNVVFGSSQVIDVASAPLPQAGAGANQAGAP